MLPGSAVVALVADRPAGGSREVFRSASDGADAGGAGTPATEDRTGWLGDDAAAADSGSSGGGDAAVTDTPTPARELADAAVQAAGGPGPAFLAGGAFVLGLLSVALYRRAR